MQLYVDWLKNFLAHRGLDRPSGAMLFTYRTSKDEYLSLRELLARKLALLDGQHWTFGSAFEAALFVLYASEWWRREYAGGAWRWMHILQSISSYPIELDPVERTAAVEMGLRHWGQPPSGKGKKYFGAIVAQGGLPLQMVANGDGAITRLLIRGTRQGQLFAWDSAHLEAFFEAHEQELVQHLRDDNIHKLLAAVVVAVLELRRKYRLAGVSNPVATLDRVQPKWRECFPFVVDGQSAEPLLVDLVKEAARDVKPVTAYPVQVSRSLIIKPDGESFELAMDIEMPSNIALSALADAYGVPADTVPQSFSLELIGAEKLRLGDGRQLLSGDDPGVMLTGRPKRVHGDAAVHEQALVLRCLGEDVNVPVSVPGGETLDERQPWVFAARETGWVLAGVGSCRVSELVSLIAVADGAQLVAHEDGSTVTLKGYTEGVSIYRWIYEVQGSATVMCDDARYSIRTAQAIDTVDQYVWRGTRAPYSAKPMAVYVGVPQLCRVSPDGALSQVSARDIEWIAPVKNGARITNIRQHRGPVDAWLLNDGVRQRRFRMALVSEEAMIRFRSGDTEREGAVELHGWGIDSAAAPPALTGRVEIQATLACLVFRADGIPPASVVVSVSWAGSATALRLELPFPSSGGRFANSEGIALANGLSMPLRKLHGVRVQVFDRNPEARKRYSLLIELKGSTWNGPGERLWSELIIPIDPHGFGELRLMEIEPALLALMSQSNELDARLRLSLCTNQVAIRNLFLTRYDIDLERQPAVLSVANASLSRLTVEELAGINLRALPLLVGAAQEILLEQTTSCDMPVGMWNVTRLEMARGPWLVYPAPDSTVKVRPTLYPGFGIKLFAISDPHLCPLGAAMATSNGDHRLSAIARVVAEMGGDLDHPSWALVIKQYQNLSHLPLSTFDYWRVLARSPATSLAAVLKLSNDTADLMVRMREELGVIWELTPRSVLKTSLNSLMQWWARTLNLNVDDSLVRLVSEPIFRSLGKCSTVLGQVVDLVMFHSGFSCSDQLAVLNKAFERGARSNLQELWSGQNSGLQRILLRTHVDDRFWPYDGLMRDLCKSLQHDASPRANRILEELGRDLLWLPTIGDGPVKISSRKEDVGNVPILAALRTHFELSPTWWESGQRMLTLRRIRNFDPHWFEVSFHVGFVVALFVEQQLSVATGKPTPANSEPLAKLPEHDTVQTRRFKKVEGPGPRSKII